MASAVSLNLQQNYSLSAGYKAGVIGSAVKLVKSTPAVSSTTETDETPELAATTAQSSSNGLIASGKGVTSKSGVGIPTTSSSESSSSDTAGLTIKEMAASIAQTLLDTAPEKAAAVQVNNKSDVKIGGSKKYIKDVSEVEAELNSKFNSINVQVTWSRNNKKVTTTLTLREMQALKEIYEQSDNASFSGTHGTERLLAALQSKGITYASIPYGNRTSITFDSFAESDNDNPRTVNASYSADPARTLKGGSKASSTDHIGVMVNSDEFKAAYSKAISSIQIN